MPEVYMFHPFVSEEAIEGAIRVLRSRWIGQGPRVGEFEQALKNKFGFRFPVVTNSGTAALHLALVLAGVGPGDEVITTPMTCTATNHPILQQFAIPVFADVQYETGNINPADIEHRITEKTKAIMCTHWAGYPCDLAELETIAKDHSLALIQDGAHALGATYRGYPLSEWGDYLMISFQAVKIITTIDGGLLVCSNGDKYQEAIRRRWYGIDRDRRTPTVEGYWDWDTTELGFKYHMNDVCAAIGLGNLLHFDELYERRAQIVDCYRKAFAEVLGITLFEQANDRISSHWLFTMHVERRGDFCRAMRGRGVEVSIVHRRNDVYPVFGGRRNDLPNLDRYEKTNISLPLHNHLTNEEVELVIESVKKGW